MAATAVRTFVRAESNMHRILFRAGLALLAAAAALPAQTTFPFQIRISQGGNVVTVPNGSTLTMAADVIGKTAELNVTVIYLGQTSATFAGPPFAFGSVAFKLVTPGEYPVTLKPGDKIDFTIQFTPASSSAALAQINQNFTEVGPPNPTTGQPTTNFGIMILNLTGTAPEFIVSYALQIDGNVLSLASGGVLLFNPTLVNNTAVATVIVSNRGSGPGLVSSITVSGEAFQPLGMPGLPGIVAANSELRFLIRYSPRQIRTDSGALEITFGNSQKFTATIEGSAIGPSFAYDLLLADSTTPVLPDQTITLSDTTVGERSGVVVRVRNTGSADGQVSLVAVTGAGFQLTDVPPIPRVVPRNESFVFTVTFAPQQPGRATGRLRVGNDAFDLVGMGIGPRLIFAYTSGSVSTNVLPGGAVVFSQQTVGQTQRMSFKVQNTGTAAASLISIGVTDTRNVFQIESLPALPTSLDPNASVTFTVSFTPAITGLATASLLIDAQSFTLTGVGLPPPSLPAYRFTGASGTQEPFQQPGVGLDLLEPYALPLRGTLTLTQDTGQFTADPSVQFSTGGLIVPFTIAANTTSATFANGANVIRFQTGSVATTITITPAFATQSGLDLTPTSPPTLRISVPAGPPRLLTIQLVGTSSGGFTFGITGFAPTRSLTKLDFQFTATSEVNLKGSQVSMNVQNESAIWYRNPSSQAFGSQFTVNVPFTLRLESGAVSSLTDKITSVSVTATNDQGTSTAVSLNLR